MILFVSVIRHQRGKRRNIPLLLLLIVSALQSVLLGLRWGYHIQELAYVSPIVATIVPPLVYSGVRHLVGADTQHHVREIPIFLAPAVTVITMSLFWRNAIDLTVVFVFFCYAVAALRLLWSGADSLGYTSLEDTVWVYRAIFFAAMVLLFTAAFDTVIYLDFLWNNALDVSTVLAIGDMIMLGVLGVAVSEASRGRIDYPDTTATPWSPPAAPLTTPQEPSQDKTAEIAGATSEDTVEETMARLSVLMQERKLYRDANLNLDRIARKAMIPTRQISQAVNMSTGQNVSQYVNGFRIAEACELLETTSKPITEIMFDVGFQTKSNFNREFRRITDLAPKDWRTSRGNKSEIAMSSMS
ncbi:MAG: helix-turn-helix domain-containing protein [Paenirhodobacter sp.]